MPKISLRAWQRTALQKWKQEGYHGIISVVTGGGKTIFALSCIAELKPKATLIVVPTMALLEQWWEESANYFDMQLDEINIIDGRLRFKQGTVNIAVINTAVKLSKKIHDDCFLIVDECHKAASDKFQRIFDIKYYASLGLSATPERPYDDGLDDILIPNLGPVIFTYNYNDAMRDGAIVPFDLHNILFDLEDDRQLEYNKISKSIAVSIKRNGPDADETIALYLKRSRIINLSLNRVRLTLKLIASNPRRRILVFHEDIDACELINNILTQNDIDSGIYHSKMPTRQRAETLAMYRNGIIDVLVTCRALDEGFNVPETELGIIAASTATRRQRIQRLGRILRPAEGKTRAIIYSLVASNPEVIRLKEEEENLEGVATVTWSEA